MNNTKAIIQIDVDVTNPGQFFACCGLLELADRLWGEAEGWFEQRRFTISTGGELTRLVREFVGAPLRQIDPDDGTASPLELGPPFRMRLDWWQDEGSGGKNLKVWAGTMDSTRIARAMRSALTDGRFHDSRLFDVVVVVFDPIEVEKKVEPFYFDARRGPNAHSRDVGFSPNDLQMTTTAFPTVEILCFVGLQRALPTPTDQRGFFEYHTWSSPIPTSLVPAAVCGLLPVPGRRGFRFENWYRTGQRKHKAFRSAIPISTGGDS